MFYKNQHGFQKEKSAEHAKLDLYPNIIKTIENKEIQAACFYTLLKNFAESVMKF